MSYPFRYILLVGTAAVLLMAVEVSVLHAQSRSNPSVRTGGTVTNLYHTLDPRQPIDAIRVELPQGWSLKQIHLLRYGSELIPVRTLRTPETGTHLFAVTKPISGPHELVLRVQLPRRDGVYDWRVSSLVQSESSVDSSEQSSFREQSNWSKRVSIQPSPRPDGTNRALDLADAIEPVVVEGEGAPSLQRRGSFTIEFWMLTNGLDEVVLSAWNGDESVAYPAEFVVDRAGRLRFYSGRPGNHRALRTGTPVADGKWHHVAVVYDHSASEVRLIVDGTLADSSHGYVTPASQGPLPLALGGRLQSDEGDPLFSGQFDEVRIWSKARSLAAVRRTKSRSFGQSTVPRSEESVMHLGFESPDVPGVNRWPEGARRIPVALTFESGLRHFRAQTDGSTVTLNWAVDARDIDEFVIERSSDGTRFAEVARLGPSEVKQPSVSEIPEFAFTDSDVAASVVFYRIRLLREGGDDRTSGTIKIGLGSESDPNEAVELVGNFPNPFAETTTIAFEVHQSQPIAITVWDLAGHRIATLIDEERGAGYHEVSFEAAELPSGTYFVRLETPTGTQSHRMVVLK